ncbi:MAG: hypothetical protein COA96_04955 [SAR86 cluster bacterium]|uniref:Uncharacterized protein n=1 Tax=SAR86 cluster bacterium TaxID=2030880 RepID=A0A2A5B5S5_9GAMM|nr:MAG: hypothetical protein COA96_04955 [SAR86 cluster bacterium]
MKNTEAIAYHPDSMDLATDQAGPILHMNERVQLLANSLSRIVEFDSFSYQSVREGVYVSIGSVEVHKCNYKIKESGRERGEFTLTRATPFKEEELMIIETAMGSIIQTCHL